MNPTDDEKMRALLDRFYRRATARHPARPALANKFARWLAEVREGREGREGGRQEAGRQEDFELKSIQVRRKSNIEVGSEFQSLRVTNTSSRKNLEVSRSKLSRKSESSKELLESENKFFGCEWVYGSQEALRSVFFAVITGYILLDSKTSFKLLEDRVNEELEERPIHQLLMITVMQQWNRLKDIFLRGKGAKWQNILREVADKMPLDFLRTLYALLIGLPLPADALPPKLALKLAKETKTSIVNFTIAYREIESIEKQGSGSLELAFGYLRHSKCYVIANRTPEYSEQEKEGRVVRTSINSNLNNLLKALREDESHLGLEEFMNVVNEKSRIVKDYYQKKVDELTQL